MTWGGSELTEMLGALAYASTNQGYEPLAKDDVLYYGVGVTIAALATDRSQYLDNQTTAATWHYEASPATRFNVASSWSIEADIDTDNNDTGFLFNYSSGANQLALSVNGSGSLQARLAGSVIGTLALPGIGASAAQYIVGWSTEPNLATTGAGDALRSVLYAFNVAAGTYDQLEFTHAIRAVATGNQVWWASTTGGGSPFTGTPNACRFGAGRFRTPTETREDFIGRTTAPTLTSTYAVAYPAVDTACDIAEPGQFAGPIYAQGSAAAASHALRVFSSPRTLLTPEFDIFTDVDDALYPTAWHVPMDTPPGESVDFQLCGNLLWRRVLPPACTHVRVRVWIDQSAADSADTLSVRAYSMNRPPDAAHVLDHEQSFDERHVTETHAADGEGWLTFDPLEVVRNSAGETWIGIGLGFTTVGLEDDFLLHAVTTEPLIA